jgi:hypothetical protein
MLSHLARGEFDDFRSSLKCMTVNNSRLISFFKTKLSQDARIRERVSALI